jgi:hypothetical protein
MIRSVWTFFLAQAIIMYAFATAANTLHSPSLIIAWMALTLATGLLWERLGLRQKAQRKRPVQQESKTALRILAYLCGVVAAAIVAVTDLSLWHRQGLMISLVGVQFFIPLGAFILGAITSTIYVWVRQLMKIQPAANEMYMMASLGILSMAFSYLIFFLGARDLTTVPSGDFLNTLRDKNLFGHRPQLFGLAPAIALTPLVQLVGYVAGSWFVFWREERREHIAV